jgi:hypothetical protein
MIVKYLKNLPPEMLASYEQQFALLENSPRPSAAAAAAAEEEEGEDKETIEFE